MVTRNSTLERRNRDATSSKNRGIICRSTAEEDALVPAGVSPHTSICTSHCPLVMCKFNRLTSKRHTHTHTHFLGPTRLAGGFCDWIARVWGLMCWLVWAVKQLWLSLRPVSAVVARHSLPALPKQSRQSRMAGKPKPEQSDSTHKALDQHANQIFEDQ